MLAKFFKVECRLFVHESTPTKFKSSLISRQYPHMRDPNQPPCSKILVTTLYALWLLCDQNFHTHETAVIQGRHTAGQETKVTAVWQNYRQHVQKWRNWVIEIRVLSPWYNDFILLLFIRWASHWQLCGGMILCIKSDHVDPIADI